MADLSKCGLKFRSEPPDFNPYIPHPPNAQPPAPRSAFGQVDSADRPDHAVVIEDAIERHVVRLGLQVFQKGTRKAQAHGERPGLQRGQRLVKFL